MKTTAKKPQGEMRQSQLVTTFGPGSMVDLPNHSVLVGGLDFWSLGGDAVPEPRLTQKLAQIAGVPQIQLRTPPPASDDPLAPATGITAFQFPEWFITQDVEPLDRPGTRSRLLVHRKALTKGKYIDREKKRRTVVPVRFVRACPAGHIGDIDWYVFVHNGRTDCAKQQRQIYLDERGTSGDLTEIWVRCECGRAERSMAQAAILANKALGSCDGARPWLGAYTKESCALPNRLLVRSASNAYFPQIMSVISLPDRDEALQKAIDTVWGDLETVESAEELRFARKKRDVKLALEAFSDEEILAELQARRAGNTKLDKKVKVAELETLITAKDQVGEDRIEGVFYARSLPRPEWDKPWMAAIEKVVLVHRLREVVAQVGFTRFESASPDTEGELDMSVRRAALAREITWLPAYENKGEGVFLQFSSKAIQSWMARPQVQKRAGAIAAGYKAWQKDHPGSNRALPNLDFLMLHSFSHLLITAVALGCGYPASSIRERVYAIPGIGYGVLLYTGSSDSEGTLGGLVQVGRRIQEHVRSALDLGALCSNDPVCAQHDPGGVHERRFLHGAACHGCLLISETSCEQQNDFLDRTLVVRTVENLGAEFFLEEAAGEGSAATAGTV